MFLSRQFYIFFALAVIVTGCGYVFPPLYIVGVAMVIVLVLAASTDALVMVSRGSVHAVRRADPRFSNGDRNKVEIQLSSTYPFGVQVEVVDEIPAIFQLRDLSRHVKLKAGGTGKVRYMLVPKERGEFEFGVIQLFTKSPLGLVSRRIRSGERQTIKVYPSFLRLSHYEIATMRSNTEAGNKKIRKAGNDTEFAQIRDYMPDDDYRKINWKASARRNQLMVNVYEEEKAQHVYSIIDTGRVMQQSFEGMSLLDHSVNAALVLSHIALKKDDNVGVATFSNKPGAFLPANHNANQISLILENLYNIQTNFLESNFASLSESINRRITKRSLIILYTNFFSINALNRQLAYLQQINKRHRLLVVFFEDNEQNAYIHTQADSREECFRHVIAEKYANDRRTIITLLQQHGIMSVLTEPKRLTTDVINKYIDIKSRNLF